MEWCVSMSEIYTPPTKKSFSFNALARWGERLASSPVAKWEALFPPEILRKGRQIYHSAKIAEISLEADSAAVIFRPEERTSPMLQIIFDIDGKGFLHWRSSSPAPREIDAPFAVAGLYVVEEFVGTEFPSLPLSAGTQTQSSEKKPTEESGNHQEEKTAAEMPSHRLCVKFFVAENEIFFTALWDGDAKKNALDDAANAQKKSSLSSADSTQLLRLVAAARKAEFAFVPSRKAYVLAGTARAVRFVGEFFPLWKKRFEILNEEPLVAFSQGVRTVDARLRLHSESRTTFGAEWDFSLNGEKFTEKETQILLKHRGETVFLPGRGLVKLRGNAKAIADDWPEIASSGVPIYTLLSIFRDNSNVPATDAKLSAWRKNFLKEPKPLAGLPDFLRPYQARGVAWIRQMFHRGAHPLLADEMGLGKTLQTLTLISLDATPERPALIVCPASVIPVWKNEAHKFFPSLRVSVLGVNDGFLRRKNTKTLRPHIWLASYGMLRTHADAFPKKHFSCAVLDEAQNIKNPQAKATLASLKIVADHRLALTGTPIENRHLDIWTIFRFLMPGLLGRRATLENELVEDGENASEKLRTQIAPFILRRTKRDVAQELPEKNQSVLHCPLTAEQRARYTSLVEEGLSALGGSSAKTDTALSENSANVLALLMRLRQVACDPALLPGCEDLPLGFSGKISVLLDRLEEIIDSGGKVVVFSQFVSLLERVRGGLEKRFAGTPIFSLTGKTRDRETPVENFQTCNGAAVFLVSLRAGGTGLTLHSAEYVFLLDPWWNPAVEEQAIDRVHRIGQKRRVFVYRMVAAGTVEERIEKLKQTKREMFDSIVGTLPDMTDWARHYPSLESLIALSE